MSIKGALVPYLCRKQFAGAAVSLKRADADADADAAATRTGAPSRASALSKAPLCKEPVRAAYGRVTCNMWPYSLYHCSL
jgi:hypothetical protein